MSSIKEKEVSETLERLNRDKMSHFAEKSQLKQKQIEAVRESERRIRQEELDKSRLNYEKKARKMEKFKVDAQKQIMFNRVAN